MLVCVLFFVKDLFGLLLWQKALKALCVFKWRALASIKPALSWRWVPTMNRLCLCAGRGKKGSFLCFCQWLNNSQ
jgi:hypothetical protein